MLLRLLALVSSAWGAGPLVSPLLPPFLPPLPDLTPLLGSNLEELVKAAAATCEVLPLDVLFSRHYTLELPHLELVEFSRTSQRRYRALDAATQVAIPPGSLLLYVPGWWNAPDDESTSALVEGLLTKHPKVLVLDTRLSFSRGYVASASRVKPIAHLLYTFIKKLIKNGVPLESIHIIGFSLGAHVAGMTGKLVQKGMKKKLERITALDPAKPCFARSTEYRLSKDDAKFVQVIHSSAGTLGLEQPLGHADLYMNGVYGNQPECEERSFKLQCDHSQAWKMYAKSVRQQGALKGRKCSSWQELEEGRCDGNVTELGYGCLETTRGMFLYKSGAERKRQVQENQIRMINILNPLTWFGR